MLILWKSLVSIWFLCFIIIKCSHWIFVFFISVNTNFPQAKDIVLLSKSGHQLQYNTAILYTDSSDFTSSTNDGFFPEFCAEIPVTFNFPILADFFNLEQSYSRPYQLWRTQAFPPCFLITRLKSYILSRNSTAWSWRTDTVPALSVHRIRKHVMPSPTTRMLTLIVWSSWLSDQQVFPA